ncbi:concanavalin A-like lectin/glucanase domain-containing protein [Lasiosphaeria hispida]|uniref:Glucanase n=1 Tax=Lasiosphaeria hispida TaxID=260671 RepID=A0AAJ0HGX2_9PEZI|nr:concanavalin A-like lectin/glucanase domain-containing protein [Lasiosphaeria hispida]
MSGVAKYQMFTLMDNEFTFDVHLSTVECGLYSTLYLVAMDEDGGMAKYSSNKAGAKYGTGYCDAQCARDLKFVGGKGNAEGWKASSNHANAGVSYGGCCAGCSRHPTPPGQCHGHHHSIALSCPHIPGDITPEFCKAAPAASGDRDRFEEVGDFSQLNAALNVPMVLVMSI